MSDLLQRLDAAIDGCCPCGAEPREGSAYCSDDCTPTHRSRDTTSEIDGTPMRWRPDLVTAVDDNGLLSLGSNTWYAGRFHAQLFERDQRTWHLRLDDGYRFVGADLNDIPDVLDDATKERVSTKWTALERELTNARHLEYVEDPMAPTWDLIRHPAEAYSQMIDRIVLGVATHSASAGETVTYTIIDEPLRLASRQGWSTGGWSAQVGADAEGIPDGWGNRPIRRPGYITETSLTMHLDDTRARLASLGEQIAPALRDAGERMGARMQHLAGRFPELFPEHCSNEVAEHPMLRAIEQRRNRNTGPAEQRRAPRQINPRRIG